MSSTVNLKAVGLVTQPNNLQSIEGALQVASNVVIRRDNVVESRRGFKLYGNTFGTSSDTAKQLLSYKDTILRHYNTTLQYDVDGTFTSFGGSYSEPVAGIRIKFIESNGNFYFTTDDGVKKISAKTNDDIAGSTISSAGGVKALDTQASLSVELGDASGFLPQDSAVAYRVVWGIKDANSNLILGTPSQRVEIYNPLSALIAQDVNNLLFALDKCGLAATTELLSSTDYLNTLKVDYNAVGTTLKTAVVSLGAKIDQDILLANDTGSGAPLNIASGAISSGICTITFSSGNPSTYLTTGSKIYVNNITAASGTLTGLQTITAVGATTLSFATSATGAVTTGATSTIEWGEYRYILANGSTDYPTALDNLTVDSPATNDQLATIQDTLSRFISRLKLENTTYIINSTAATAFILPLQTTTTANVLLEFTIPDDVTASYFYQVYRSSIVQATGTTILTDLVPSDELQLVYEAFPTSAELSAQYIQFTDVTPDAFRGANLYTNASTGEGILQANDVPPSCNDINKFKNYTFYANTRTRHRLLLNMLGIEPLLTEYAAGRTPRLTIANTGSSTTFSFVTGVQEVTDITAVADVADSLNGKYFTLNSANDDREYYFWFKTSGASASDPAVSGKTGVRIDITTGAAANTVAGAVRDAINYVNIDFSAANNTLPTIRVTNVNEGPATDATAGTSGFTVTVITQGRGEDLSTNQVLLSSDASVGIATDATARSLVKAINRSSAPVYAYYLSGANDVPGKMLIESRTLGTTANPFYIVMNNGTNGVAFNPDLSPELQVDAGSNKIVKDTPATGQTKFFVTAHGLLTGDQVLISGTANASTPLAIDGIYTITKIDANSFYITATIASTVNVTANTISVTYLLDAEVSDNEVKPNRMYYSKFQQPEAVPLVNTIDLGAADKAILRILPLRDSLFVFKEDGLFRISGEVAPFNSSLFDVSCLLLAPDSLGVLNNVIYGWTRKGIENISEAGSQTISRFIDVDILPKATAAYTNFYTATFGIGYESDNSYIVWTVTERDDEIATVAYRYSNLTNSWTTFDKTNTCAIMGPADDKLYLGAGDVNSIEQERKDFERTDYADREYTKTLANSFLSNSGKTLKFGSVSDFEVGDVLVQTQYVTVYEYNALLQKLDLDPGVGDDDYYETLEAVAGDNMRTKLEELADKLDADSGVNSTDYADRITAGAGPYSTTISSVTVADPAQLNTAADHGLYSISNPSEGRWVTITGTDTNATTLGTFEITRVDNDTFSVDSNVISVTDGTGTLVRLESDERDIKACYNIIIDHLNNDSGVSFSNYSRINHSTELEAIVTAVNNVSNTVTVNLALDFTVGDIVLYKHINTEIVYTPQTFGDPLGLKHIREATIMFENKAFTKATLSFSTDLLPAYIDVDFNGNGNGIFGNGEFFGADFFGGAANSAPFRTYIPRDCQRCRYLNVKFIHGTAREKYSLFGITLTGSVGQSSRGYR